MKPTTGKSSGEAGPPTSYPEGDPPNMPMDHSWTLQAVMEMKGTLGELNAKIDHMRNEVATLATKIDDNVKAVGRINTKLAWVAGVASAIAAIAVIVWALVSAVPWSRISIAPAQPTAQQPAPSTSSQANRL